MDGQDWSERSHGQTGYLRKKSINPCSSIPTSVALKENTKMPSSKQSREWMKIYLQLVNTYFDLYLQLVNTYFDLKLDLNLHKNRRHQVPEGKGQRTSLRRTSTPGLTHSRAQRYNPHRLTPLCHSSPTCERT